MEMIEKIVHVKLERPGYLLQICIPGEKFNEVDVDEALEVLNDRSPGQRWMIDALRYKRGERHYLRNDVVITFLVIPLVNIRNQ